MIAAHSRPGTTIHTDKHRTYSIFSKVGFVHNSICHKYSLSTKKMVRILNMLNPLIVQ
ncbi:hypothetical protein H312_03480 [Anncaliia algerae PRA339]|uniref:ISXO2-like transposase domain-containing protein n=1 Tax=Anncaliia algerae PRA339 TaxID=1288291 RepID=A0A059EVV2_9MICR|nr:hypothetical protein H312_03480 [Anncaliia algerae PRA339]